MAKKQTQSRNSKISRAAMAAAFRSLQAKFERMAAKIPATTDQALRAYSLRNDAGKVVMKSFHAGYLPMIPGIAHLVAWAEGPDPQDGPILCNPYNVFCRLVGGFALDVQNGVEPGTEHIGILPQLYPQRFPSRSGPEPLAESPGDGLVGLTPQERCLIATQYEDAALACSLLAELIEQTS